MHWGALLFLKFIVITEVHLFSFKSKRSDIEHQSEIHDTPKQIKELIQEQRECFPIKGKKNIKEKPQQSKNKNEQRKTNSAMQQRYYISVKES